MPGNDIDLRPATCGQLRSLHAEAMRQWEEAIHAMQEDSIKFGREADRIERAMRGKGCSLDWKWTRS